MRTPRNYRLSLIAAASMTGAMFGSAGCTGSIRLYDADRGDYHQWDNREDRAYRSYMLERHQEYRPIAQLNADDQRDYWRWRHAHEDAGN